MKRSSHVNLTIIGTLSLALAPIISACHGNNSEPRHCIDANQQVVDEQHCGNVDNSGSSGSVSPYYWYYGGSTHHTSSGTSITGGSRTSSRASSGSRSSSSHASSRGGFGSTAHASAGGSGS